MAAMELQTANSSTINRTSVSVDLVDRYNKSKIKEVQAPTAVDFMDNTYAKGFLMKERTLQTEFKTGAQSIFLKGFSNAKYKG